MDAFDEFLRQHGTDVAPVTEPMPEPEPAPPPPPAPVHFNAAPVVVDIESVVVEIVQRVRAIERKLAQNGWHLD